MREIPLSRGLVALVDDEDYDRINQWRWYAHTARGYTYARRNAPRGSREGGVILMHRVVVGAPPALIVDHRDHQTLNNQRANLRICERLHNQRNRRKSPGLSSAFKGVDLKAPGRWRAKIQDRGRQIYLGVFQTEIEAALAYDRAAGTIFGEFAVFNFPRGQ